MAAPIQWGNLTFNFDSHIQTITQSSTVWTTSGEAHTIYAKPGSDVQFTVVLDSGYILDTISEGSINADGTSFNLTAPMSDTSGADVYTVTSKSTTPRISVDVSTLPGWANLSAGEHDITVVAKANGFKDSAPSAAVQVEKAPAVYKIPAGEYCIKYDLANGDVISNLPNESKYIIDSNFQTYDGWGYSGNKSTGNKIKITVNSDGTKNLRYEYVSNYDTVMDFDAANKVTYIYDYRSSVIFANEIEVDKDTYDLFYAIYETIKVITPGIYKWVQNVELGTFQSQMSLNFKSNGVNYNWFGVNGDNSYYRLFYSTSSWGEPTVYDSSGWKLEAYKTFEVLSARNIGRSRLYAQFTNGKIVKQ